MLPFLADCVRLPDYVRTADSRGHRRAVCGLCPLFFERSG